MLLHNYCHQDENSLCYSLSLKLKQISALVCGQAGLAGAAHQYMEELSNRCMESLCLAVAEHNEAVCVDVVNGQIGMLQIMQQVGRRVPMYCTAEGKILLSSLREEDLAAYLGHTPLKAVYAKNENAQGAHQAALCASGPSFRMTAPYIREMYGLLKDTAAQISRSIMDGYPTED